MRYLNKFCKLLAVGFLAQGVLAQTAIAVDINAEDIVNMKVIEDGMYQLSFEQLRDFGADIEGETIDRIAVVNRGQSIPVQVIGSTVDSQVFGAGGYVRFIAKGLDTLYTDTNVYTLRLDFEAQQVITASALELVSRAAFATSYLASKSFAPQEAYAFASPDRNDPWYAKRLLALDQPAQDSVSINLDDYAPGGNSGEEQAEMNLKVWGGSSLIGGNDDHHLRVSFNGLNVIDQTFDGFVKKEMSSTISNLKVGDNVVGLELPLDQGHRFEAVNLDSIEIKYPRAFVAQNESLSFTSSQTKFRVRGFSDSDIRVYRQAQGQVTQLVSAQAGGRCGDGSARCSVQFSTPGGVAEYLLVTPTSTKTPELSFIPLDQDIRSGNAEYLIITHPDFIASGSDEDLLGSLVADLENSFSSVDVVDVEQIYAQFGNHIFDPQALRDYIKFSVQNRGSTTVLLVGGDVYDYRGFENSDARSFIPSIYMATGDIVSFAPVDAKYVDLDDDNTPDLALGRLPIRTMGELKILLAKRTAYLNRDYDKRALFSADLIDDIAQYSFKLDAQSIAQDFFQGWTVETAFPDDVGIRDARNRIIDEINQGVSLTSFFGHSSTAQWSFDGLFNGFDAAQLQNQGRPTVVTQWGCWNTYYVNPNEDSMGHRFLMEGDRGAVAVMGATTLTSASNEKLLSRLVFERLTQGESLGQAITNGKAEFAETRPDALDVILGWTLLGFPELIL